MDYRDSYQLLCDKLAGHDPRGALAGLLRQLATVGPAAGRSAVPGFMAAFAAMPPVPDDYFGYARATAYVSWLRQKKPELAAALGTAWQAVSESEWKQAAEVRLAQGHFALLCWLIGGLAAIYRPCHQLDQTLARFTAPGPGHTVNPYLEAYVRSFIARPDLANDGYANATTLLFESGDNTAQTVLMRLGKTLWQSARPLFSCYNPHDVSGRGVAFDFASRELVFGGAEAFPLAPLFVFFGYTVSCTVSGKTIAAVFPFEVLNPTDLVVTGLAAEPLRLSYLDELATARVSGARTFYDLLRAADRVVFAKPVGTF